MVTGFCVIYVSVSGVLIDRLGELTVTEAFPVHAQEVLQQSLHINRSKSDYIRQRRVGRTNNA